MNTCGTCEHVCKTEIKGLDNAFIIGCQLTNEVVPHSVDFQSGQVVFWRVPMSCPRTDTVKSENKAPKSDWIKISIHSIKNN